MILNDEVAGLSLPKIRSRAALYRASLSFKDSCVFSAEPEGVGDGVDCVGRLRIFILGNWSKTPCGGTCADGMGAAVFLARTTSGIGWCNLVFLQAC